MRRAKQAATAIRDQVEAVEGPGRVGWRRTRTADGGEAEFCLGTDQGAHFMVNHFSPGETLDLIFRAPRIAGLVILGDFPPVLTDAHQLDHLPSELSDLKPVLVVSGAEVGALIAGDSQARDIGRRRLIERS